MAQARAICIPVEGSDEVVAVPVDELPDDPEELLEPLRAEGAPLVLWLDFAKAYLAQGRAAQFVHILVEGTSKDVEAFFGEVAKFERITIFCALAAYYTAHARAIKERVARADAFNKASTYLANARQIDVDEQLCQLTAGQLALAKGDLELARKEFERGVRLLSNGRKNVSCTLALASVLFHTAKYSQALALYCRALSEHPSAPAELRLGLAACYYRLGRIDRAEAAYRRVLALAPDNTDARIGLALLCFNRGGPATKQGLALLHDAYAQAPRHPLVLNLLAHYCLIKKDYDKVKALAGAALESSDVDTVSSAATCYLARAYHALGARSDAYRNYQAAMKLDGAAVLPRYGMAQMLLLQREHTNAVTLLENIVADVPGWDDAIKILGALYPHLPSKSARAVSHFKEAAAKEGASALIWEMLGDLLAATDPAGALAAYKRAIELYRNPERPPEHTNGADAEAPDGGASVPAKLLNNAAVLLMRVGDTAAALELMQQALAAPDSGEGAAGKLTLGYNSARVKEARGLLSEAEKEYRAILEQFPGYVDCHLRLASIAHNRGDMAAALAAAKRAVGAKASHADALAMLASLHSECGQFDEARAVLESLAKASSAEAGAGSGGGRYEAYARLGQGNICLYKAPPDRRKEEARKKADDQLRRALSHFQRVLEKDESNAYAANGLGAVLAEAGHTEVAKDIFLQVQEAVASTDGFASLPHAWVNLGHCYLAQRNHVSAVRMYSIALRKYYDNKDPEVLLYLARAYYDSKQLPEAISTLRSALHLRPGDCTLRFNLALCIQEAAVQAIKAPPAAVDDARVAQLERCGCELRTAQRMFAHLRGMGAARSGMDDARLDSHVSFCRQTVRDMQLHLDRARSEAALLQNRRRQQEAQVAAQRAQRELEAARRAAAEAQARDAREAAARENAARLALLREKWQGEQAMMVSIEGEGEGAKGKGKKRKKGKGADEEAAFIDDARPGAGSDSEAEPEYRERNGAAASEVEAEQHARLAAAGLESDSDEEQGGGGGGAAQNGGAAGAEAGPSSALAVQDLEKAPDTGGRIKKRRRLGGGGGGGVAGAVEGGLEDEDDDEGAGEGARRRKAAALFDDSEEDEAAAAAPSAPPAEGPPPPQDDEGGPAQPMVDDLFGSDDED